MWKKNIKRATFIFILMIIYIYIIAIDAIPNQIVIFEGESVKVNSAMGLGIKEEETVTTNIGKTSDTTTKTLSAITTISDNHQTHRETHNKPWHHL